MLHSVSLGRRVSPSNLGLALLWFVTTGALLTMVLAYADEGTWRMYNSFLHYLVSGDIASGDLLIWTGMHTIIGIGMLTILLHTSRHRLGYLLVITLAFQVAFYMTCILLLHALL